MKYWGDATENLLAMLVSFHHSIIPVIHPSTIPPFANLRPHSVPMDPDFWMSLAICVTLVSVALWLINVHWQHWQEVDADTDLQPRERDHLRRRHRRRMQTSMMLGFVGVAILAGRLFPPDDPSLVTVLYWTGVALLVLWMALLALADMIATRVHYGVKRRKVVSERTRLEAQLRRMVDEHRNRESSQSGEEDDPTPDDRDRSE